MIWGISRRFGIYLALTLNLHKLQTFFRYYNKYFPVWLVVTVEVLMFAGRYVRVSVVCRRVCMCVCMYVYACVFMCVCPARSHLTPHTLTPP